MTERNQNTLETSLRSAVATPDRDDSRSGINSDASRGDSPVQAHRANGDVACVRDLRFDR